MRILILGGTVFVGRALTDAALAARHDVTHFNRGLSAPPDPRVRAIKGDRTAFDPAALAGAWDAVIDTSGYLPQVVAPSVVALHAGAARYLFVSSISAYAPGGYAEESALQPPPDPVPDTLVPEAYGALKAACEGVVRRAFGERALVVRPGLIVGPDDPTDRFTWWPARMARGGRVAAPGRPARAVQFIDARDLAGWMIALLERDASGTFNATGPASVLTMEGLLSACAADARRDATLEWIDDAFLLEQKVAPWKEMPLWIPESDASLAGFMHVPIARALAAGLTFRPLGETIADTLAWSKVRGPHEWKAGLSDEREADLLRAWGARVR